MRTKWEKSLNLLQQAGDAWPPKIKLILYKQFSRSTTDYGLPFLYHYFTTHKDNQLASSHLSSLEDLHSKALSWILFNDNSSNTTTFNPNKKPMASLTGLGFFTQRCFELAARFSLVHLPSLDQENPIHKLINYYKDKFPWPAVHVLPRCSSFKININTEPAIYKKKKEE